MQNQNHLSVADILNQAIIGAVSNMSTSTGLPLPLSQHKQPNTKETLELRDFVQQNMAQLQKYPRRGAVGTVTQNKCNLKSLREIVGISVDSNIGTGGFGSVHKGSIANQPNWHVAIKEQLYKNQNDVRRLQTELGILKTMSDAQVNMPFVLMYFGACDDRQATNQGTVYEIMELGQGSLEDYFDENRVANISFKQLFGIVSQILVAISWWITEFGIVHNDLYLKNVVYKPIDYQQQQEEEEEKTRDFVYHSSSSSIDLQVHVDDILVKVIDFGLASINPEQHKQVAKDFNKTDYLYPIRFFFKDCKDGYYRHVLQYDIPPYARDILAVLQNIQIGYEWNDERIKQWSQTCLSIVEKRIEQLGNDAFATLADVGLVVKMFLDVGKDMMLL